MAKPKTWKNVPKEKWEQIREFLLSQGGVQDKEVKGVKEVWRIRVQGSVITLYEKEEKGTLFGTPPMSSKVKEIYQKISEMVPIVTKETPKQFLVGLDETGKGEVLGHSILAGVAFPKELAEKVEETIGSIDTKRKRVFPYWDRMFVEIDELKRSGLDFITERIPPWHVDRYNLNKIMDLVYQRIISHLLRRVPVEDCQITIDDYGIGRILGDYLDLLSEKGAEIHMESRADEKYVQVRLASVIAKRERERVMVNISRKFSLPNVPMGSGNAGDVRTLKWLEEWKKTGKPWPWFVKQSFVTVRKLNGKIGKARKLAPPIHHRLLSDKSKESFRFGNLSVASLSIVCPDCGEILKACIISPDEKEKLVARCINPKCRQIIPYLNTTLLYYHGYIIPDSSAIRARTISRDLERGRFFENFTLLIHPVVRRECDTRHGRKELGALADFSSMGRIRMIDIDEEELALKTEKLPDELIAEASQRLNAILYTHDRAMCELASSKGMFYLRK